MGYDERWWVEREVRRERAVGGGGVYGRASPAMGCGGVEPWEVAGCMGGLLLPWAVGARCRYDADMGLELWV